MYAESLNYRLYLSTFFTFKKRPAKFVAKAKITNRNQYRYQKANAIRMHGKHGPLDIPEARSGV